MEETWLTDTLETMVMFLKAPPPDDGHACANNIVRGIRLHNHSEKLLLKKANEISKLEWALFERFAFRLCSFQ